MTEQPDLSAVLLQQAQQGQEIARQGERLGNVETQLTEVLRTLQAIQGTQRSQAVVVGKVEDLGPVVTQLVKRFDKLFPPGESDGEEFCHPAVTARWWELDGAEREKHLERIRKWVHDIYTPGFGKIAAKLPPCWEEHNLCLVILDVMAELQKVLWLQPVRTEGMLSGQAEFLTRLMSAFVDAMAAERKGCIHSQEQETEDWGRKLNGVRAS